MDFLRNFAEYLWLITKIMLMLILIIAMLSAFIKSIFGKARRNKVDEEELDKMLDEEIDELFKKRKK